MNHSARPPPIFQGRIFKWDFTQNDMASYDVLDNSVLRGQVLKWQPSRDDI